MVKQAVLGDAMGYLMNGGDVETRRFAATVLDSWLDFTGNAVAHSKQVDWLHREFQEQVRKGLYPAMSDAEAADFLLSTTLLDNGKQADLDLIFCGKMLKEVRLTVR